ncbi:MAG: hypothetical protein LJE83_06205 [Gammaproteobacteria bacterium]|jgi:hypothetical protein|nr:hypothetical protein [Gammaproteobacteria bacterium]
MKKLFLLLIAAAALPGMAKAEGDWNFALTPYAWFAGVNGTASTLPGAPVVPIEVTPSDAFNDSQVSAMLIFEAKQNRHGLLLDLIYTDSESDTTLVDAINLTLKSISRNKIYSAAYEYEFYNQDRTVVDMFAGLRYWKVDTIMEFGGGLGLLNGQRIRSAESWVDPLIGVKARTALGDSDFYAVGWLGGGGFGVGSDSFYDVSANIGYQWTKSIGTTLGYRLFNVDYKNGSFIYDMQQEGWALGLTWAF